MNRVRICKSSSTGHWVVEPDNPFTARRFRHWSDALAAANELARRRNQATCNGVMLFETPLKPKFKISYDSTGPFVTQYWE